MSKESKPFRIIIEKADLKPVVTENPLMLAQKNLKKHKDKKSEELDLEYADNFLSKHWNEVNGLYDLVYQMNQANDTQDTKKTMIKNCLEDFRGTKNFDILYKTFKIFDQMMQDFPEEIAKSYERGIYPAKKFVLDSLKEMEKSKSAIPETYTDREILTTTPQEVKPTKKRVRFNEEVDISYTEVLLSNIGKKVKRLTGEIITEKLQDEISIKDAVFNGSFKATKLNPLKKILSKPTKRDFDGIEESKSDNHPTAPSAKSLKSSPKRGKGMGI